MGFISVSSSLMLYNNLHNVNASFGGVCLLEKKKSARKKSHEKQTVFFKVN